MARSRRSRMRAWPSSTRAAARASGWPRVDAALGAWASRPRWTRRPSRSSPVFLPPPEAADPARAAPHGHVAGAPRANDAVHDPQPQGDIMRLTAFPLALAFALAPAPGPRRNGDPRVPAAHGGRPARRHHPRPDGNVWFLDLGGTRWDASHRPTSSPSFRFRRRRASPRRSPTGPTAISGSPGGPGTRSRGSRRPASSPSSRCRTRERAAVYHRGVRRQSLVHRAHGRPHRAHHPGGAVAEFSIPTASSTPVRIASGPDGDLWFVEAPTTRLTGRHRLLIVGCRRAPGRPRRARRHERRSA